ncbi:MAG: hypothetical protein PHZ04_05650 [Patescibacteria group bacterium]|nr:hypothetical protein [Patescibacteria group bacterium]MDD5295085.1 hypothetical protein [Patescibacteria group bacterium]MDD5554947.1 hypothetical protein [Patescibacteria group bacterium]
MILYIDTTNGNKIEIALGKGERTLVREEFEAKYSQAEKLLPAIKKMLAGKKIKLSAISEIVIANKSGVNTGFTALRIGVVTANALGYALGIPVRGAANKLKSKKFSGFDVIEPVYSQNPNITKQKAPAVD